MKTSNLIPQIEWKMLWIEENTNRLTLTKPSVFHILYILFHKESVLDFILCYLFQPKTALDKK